MNDETLVGTLKELIDLLRGGGQLERAAWLEERLRRLESAQSSLEVRQVHLELHETVLGMNGLIDLRLEPASDGASEAEVLEQLDVLADRLYRLTGGRSEG